MVCVSYSIKAQSYQNHFKKWVPLEEAEFHSDISTAFIKCNPISNPVALLPFLYKNSSKAKTGYALALSENSENKIKKEIPLLNINWDNIFVISYHFENHKNLKFNTPKNVDIKIDMTHKTLNSNPIVNISPSGTTYICNADETVLLTASQSSMYQWMREGIDIPNATLQNYTATAIGNYSVRVIDLFGNSSVSDTITISINSSEIDVTGSGNFGTILPNKDYIKTFTISNRGIGSLNIDSIVIDGPDSEYFSVIDITPASITAESSIDVDIMFNAPNSTAYFAELSINSDDCDESTLTYTLDAEITCLAADFTSVPSNITVNTDSKVHFSTVSYLVELINDPTAEISYTFNGATSASGWGSGSGSKFNVGTTIVNLNVKNACGNTTQSFDIVVNDIENPVIVNIPPDITITAPDTSCKTVISWLLPTATDNCSVKLNSSHESGAVFPIGITNVEYTAIDPSGNTVSANFNITINPIPLKLFISSPSTGIANVGCNGEADGTITSTVIGGCEPYIYDWSNGDTTEHVSGLGAGNYNLVITDSNGTGIAKRITLTESAVLETVIDTPTTVHLPTCAFPNTNLLFGYRKNNTTSITFNSNSIGGSGNYSYSWLPTTGLSDPTIANPTFSPKIKKTGCTVYDFTLTVTDTNGCTTNESISVKAVNVGFVKTIGKRKKNKKVHKVLICHKGRKTIGVNYRSIPAHLAHGDCLGSCNSNCGTTNNQTETTTYEGDFLIYPNPSIGTFNINFNSNNRGIKLLLYTKSGKIIKQKIIKSNTKSVKIGNPKLSAGIYILKIISADKTTINKLVVQKN